MRTAVENTVLLVISGVLATTVLACGGDSGNHANHTHGGVPALVSSSPLDSQSHVSRDATLVVEFSTELIPESIPGSVELVDASGLTVPGQTGLIAPHVIGFYPSAELPAAELFTLRVLPGLLSQTRETIPSPIEIRFRTSRLSVQGPCSSTRSTQGRRQEQLLETKPSWNSSTSPARRSTSTGSS